MQYLVKYHNPSSFMKEWAKDPNIKIEVDGRTQTTSTVYKKSNVPGTKVLFSPSFKGKMLVDMDQATLNKHVAELYIYGKDGKQITEAPLGTQNHAFWMSEHAYLMIEGGEAKLDDKLPKDAIMIAAMKMDNSFWFKGSSKPFVKGINVWIVSQLDDTTNEVVEEESAAMQAVEALATMGHEKRISIAKIFGKTLDSKTDPEVVKAILFREITTNKNMMTADGKTNLAKFMELVKSSNSELNIETLANESKQYFEKRGGYYFYGEIKMGKNISEIVEKLKTDVDLTHELDRKRKA